MGGNLQVIGNNNSTAEAFELECESIELGQIDWLASINEDNNPNPIDNYATMAQGTDSYGDYYSIEWNSPKPVDLSLNELQQFEWEGARALELTLSSDSPMDVEVWIGVTGDFCGRDWQSLELDSVLHVSTIPTPFTLPHSLFVRNTSRGCGESPTADALGNTNSVVLWPSNGAGELRVCGVSICKERGVPEDVSGISTDHAIAEFTIDPDVTLDSVVQVGDGPQELSMGRQDHLRQER